MTTLAVWDVVKVPFPYTNRPVAQYRPCLVVALPDASESLALAWVLMITSAENRPWPGDVPILDLETAGLPAASVIRTAKIATIEAHATIRLGSLASSACAAVRARMDHALATAGVSRSSSAAP